MKKSDYERDVDAMSNKRARITENEWIEELEKVVATTPPRGAITIDKLARKLNIAKSTARAIAERNGLKIQKFLVNGRWVAHVLPPTSEE